MPSAVHVTYEQMAAGGPMTTMVMPPGAGMTRAEQMMQLFPTHACDLEVVQLESTAIEV